MPDEFTAPGALIDNRPEAAKERDWTFEEIVVSTAPVNWREKKPSEWRRFPIQDQDGSGSCVAQTMKKILGVYVWLKTGIYLKLSATHIYKRRANRPSGGMAGVDAFEIAKKGTTLEEFAPSEKMSDSQMDAINIVPFSEKIGEAFKIGSYLTITDRSIDKIASIIQETGKSVMVWFYFENREWGDVPQVMNPSLNLYAAATARHSVAAVDFTMHNGKKALIIEDSWGLAYAIEGRRIITEDFFNARCFFAAHFMNFAFEDQTQPIPGPAPSPRPKYTFSRDLEFSAVVKYDVDVKALQDILKFEGVFPGNIESSGYFGSITRTAVGKFQEKHKIAAPGNAGYGRVGPLTRSKLNSIYS